MSDLTAQEQAAIEMARTWCRLNESVVDLDEAPDGLRFVRALLSLHGRLQGAAFLKTQPLEASNARDAELAEARRLLDEARKAIEAAAILAAAMETCHLCQTTLLVEDGPMHCEDGCSWDCEEHEEPSCVPLSSLHGNLKRALAAITPTDKP